MAHFFIRCNIFCRCVWKCQKCPYLCTAFLKDDSLAQLVEHIPFKDGVLSSSLRRITSQQAARQSFILFFVVWTRCSRPPRCRSLAYNVVAAWRSGGGHYRVMRGTNVQVRMKCSAELHPPLCQTACCRLASRPSIKVCRIYYENTSLFFNRPFHCFRTRKH